MTLHTDTSERFVRVIEALDGNWAISDSPPPPRRVVLGRVAQRVRQQEPRYDIRKRACPDQSPSLTGLWPDLPCEQICPYAS